MNIEVTLIERQCENCTRTFKVMAQSLNTFCSHYCQMYGAKPKRKSIPVTEIKLPSIKLRKVAT
jgi:hypothetical protein